jgi:hypothetical protein
MRDLNMNNTRRKQSVVSPNTTIKRVLLTIAFVTLIQSMAWSAHRVSESRADEPSTVLESPTVEPSGDHIFTELLRHNAFRDAALERYSVVRTYEVRSATGRLYAREIVKMDYQAPSRKTFSTVSEEGSGLVRSLVLKRLIESEKETAAGKEHHDSSIAPANYSFEMLGEEEVGHRRCFVVRAIPKREDKYLFEGTIWIDMQDYAIVKIAGHPAKRLSFWIEQADFVRQYQKIGAFWLPTEDSTVVRVRLKGTKTLTIWHEEYQVSSILDQLWGESTPQRSARLGQLPAPADESSQTSDVASQRQP